VDEKQFLDFVSRRSPVFKQRPLPRTKREAIDLMLQHPNLIKRPIVVKGKRAVFGFDKEALEALGGHER
jgi:arsenate reductase-like glutaredoxin family protein